MNFKTRMSVNNIDAILSANKPEEESGSRFYQLMRIENAEHYLELRFRDGIRTAFGYDKLGWFNYAPDLSVLDLDFMGTTVSIEGRGLSELFQMLKAKKVSWIKEADIDLEDNDTNTIFIKEITILPPPDEFRTGEEE